MRRVFTGEERQQRRKEGGEVRGRKEGRGALIGGGR